jgi:hypothetical protein
MGAGVVALRYLRQRIGEQSRIESPSGSGLPSRDILYEVERARAILFVGKAYP